jgi:hypothetical protein
VATRYDKLAVRYEATDHRCRQRVALILLVSPDQGKRSIAAVAGLLA